MKREKGFFKRVFERAATPLLALGMLAGIGGGIYVEYAPQHMQVTVTGTHRSWLNKNEGFGFTKTIYETDKGELSNTLSPLTGKFSRSAIENEIQVGKTYDVTVQGIRLWGLNKYPNIVKATPVNPQPPQPPQGPK